MNHYLLFLTSSIYLDYKCTKNVERSNKRKWFHMKKARRRRYPAETNTDADYADDLALFANTPV